MSTPQSNSGHASPIQFNGVSILPIYMSSPSSSSSISTKYDYSVTPRKSVTPPATKQDAPPKPKIKPVNVFSNDGSFLERLQRSKKELEEKTKQQEALERKKQFDNRFKNRGKRPPPDSNMQKSDTNSIKTTDQHHPSKKPKLNSTLEPLTAYEKELQKVSKPSLKDTGTGVRALVK